MALSHWLQLCSFKILRTLQSVPSQSVGVHASWAAMQQHGPACTAAVNIEYCGCRVPTCAVTTSSRSRLHDLHSYSELPARCSSAASLAAVCPQHCRTNPAIYRCIRTEPARCVACVIKTQILPALPSSSFVLHILQESEVLMVATNKSLTSEKLVC
jgi:hypothetical protein